MMMDNSLLITGMIAIFLILGLAIFVGHHFYRPNCECTCASSCFCRCGDCLEYEEINESEKKFGTCSLCLEEMKIRICQEEMKINEYLYLAPCQHTFHTECLARWLEEDDRCPLCSEGGLWYWSTNEGVPICIS